MLGGSTLDQILAWVAAGVATAAAQNGWARGRHVPVPGYARIECSEAWVHITKTTQPITAPIHLVGPRQTSECPSRLDRCEHDRGLRAACKPYITKNGCSRCRLAGRGAGKGSGLG